jgi:hypothetical protein
MNRTMSAVVTAVVGFLVILAVWALIGLAGNAPSVGQILVSAVVVGAALGLGEWVRKRPHRVT